MTDPLPRNLFLRVLIRVLAMEWFAGNAIVLTVVAIVCSVLGETGIALFTGVVALAAWAYIVWDELHSRGDQPRWP